MLSKILIIVLTLITIVAMLALKTNKVKGKMIWLAVSAIATTALSFLEMNAYGIMGGVFQVVYRVLPLLFFVILISKVCKTYGIKEVSQFDGIGRDMPYLYAIMVAFSLLIIGIPATGTFTGTLYSEIGMMAGGYGVVAYVGMLGNAMGMIVPACILFPILKRAYFLEKQEKEIERFVEEGTKEETEENEEAEEPKVKLSSSVVTAFGIVTAIFVGLCIYQKLILWLADKLLGNIFG